MYGIRVGDKFWGFTYKPPTKPFKVSLVMVIEE